MCGGTTKNKIAAVVADLLRTQPAGKITVQQVMELTQMNRQSFYYHYQDIRDVLEWIVLSDFATPLQYDPEEPLDEWCRKALTLVNTRHQVLRHISQELGSERMYALTACVFRPQVERIMPEHPDCAAQRALAVETLSRGIFCSVNDMLLRCTPVNVEQSMQRLQILAVCLRPGHNV